MGSVDGHNAQSTTDGTKPRCPATLVPVGLAVAIALYNLLLNPMHGRGDPTEWLIVLGIGVIFVQPLLLAVWAALGPDPLVYRLPVSGATLVAWIFAQGIAEWNVLAIDSATSNVDLEMAAAFIAAFVVASAVFGLLRRTSGVRISRSEPASSRSPDVRHQFGMKYLLGWMTVCALLIVVGRTFISDTLQFDQPWLSLLWDVSIAITFLLLLMAPPAVLPLLALTRPMPWRWLLLVGAAWPVSLWAAVEVVNLSSSPGPPPDSYGLFAGVQVGATAAALVCATVLRIGGFHLTSTIDPAPHL